MTESKTIAKNAAWLMLATTLQKALAFLSFFFVARWSGAAVTGQYFYALAITSTFVVLTDLGLTPVVIRAMAANLEEGRKVAAQAFRLKLILIPLGVIAALLYALLVDSSADQIIISVALACGVMAADAVSLLAYGVLRGHRQLRYEAWGMLITQVITVIGSLAAAWWWRGHVPVLVLALLLGSFWNVIWGVLTVRRLGLWPAFNDRLPWSWLAKQVAPFALAGICVKIYSYIDTLILRHYYPAAEIGHYAVAYKLTYAFQFVPLTFVAALYPGLSSAYARHNHDEVRAMFEGSLRLMAAIAVPVAACLAGFATWLPWVFGKDYADSIAPLTILAWVLIPIFLDFPIGSLLNATHRASQKTIAMAIAVIINAAFNLLLVPVYGASGAAMAGIISFSSLFLFGWWFVRRDVSARFMSWLLLRSLFLAMVLFIMIRSLLNFTHPVVTIVIIGVASLLGLWCLRFVTSADLRILKRWKKIG